MFNRTVYFNMVRKSLFKGSMTKQQVNGQNALLDAWEKDWADADLRWLAYALASTKHETASTMAPIAEIGEGTGHAYGKEDPETHQRYFGRGFRSDYPSSQLRARGSGTRADRKGQLRMARRQPAAFRYRSRNAISRAKRGVVSQVRRNA
jgi:hypothetical protein